MAIESIMYFALGALAASLLALLIIPAIWGRAVRLTKKRIEAATPMSMAEFRADKDQLRAEFALSTRRLEMNVEALRKRLAEQVDDIGKKRSEIQQLKVERDQQLQAVGKVEERESELHRRVLELEKEGADLAERLRMRESEIAEKDAELESLREEARARAPKRADLDGKPLSGDYARDVDQLLAALESERKRNVELEQQSRTLVSRLETTDRRSADSSAAVAELRQALAKREDGEAGGSSALLAAEAKLASAESRLNALLEETQQLVQTQENNPSRPVFENLSPEDRVEALKAKVISVESEILADWDGEKFSQGQMRERLTDIASEVGRLAYGVDGDSKTDGGESLFQRVQRFADDGPPSADLPPKPAKSGRLIPMKPGSGGNVVSDRLAALRDVPGRS